MTAHEWRVVSELIRSKDMNCVVRLGLNADHLRGEPEAAQIFEFLRKHYYDNLTYREFPTRSAIRRKFPSFEETSKSDSGRLATLIKELKGMSLEQDVRSLVSYFESLVDDDPVEAVQLMQSQLARVALENSNASGFSIRQIVEKVEEQYNGALTGSVYGIPWAWECLTKDTLGKNPQEFTIIYGRMKSMKTWISLINAVEDYQSHGRRVLIWSREMNETKMALRAGSILGRVDYQCLKNGTLPRPLYEKAIASMKEMASALERSQKALEKIREGAESVGDSNVPDIMFLCGRGAPTTLEEVDAVVQAFNPDIVYLDSFYRMSCASMMKMRSDHERQREITFQIKERSLNWNIPIVGTTQANRAGDGTAGETLADMGRTDAGGQEADLILRILMREGKEPYEDDYEGWWDEQERVEDAAAQGREKRRGMKLSVSKKARARFGRPSAVPKKILDKTKPKRVKRKAAEVFIIPAGNRDGVLDGFSIRCIPGYKWEVLNEDLTPQEIKRMLKDDAAEEKKEAYKKKDKPDPLSKPGMGFA